MASNQAPAACQAAAWALARSALGQCFMQSSPSPGPRSRRPCARVNWVIPIWHLEGLVTRCDPEPPARPTAGPGACACMASRVGVSAASTARLAARTALAGWRRQWPGPVTLGPSRPTVYYGGSSQEWALAADARWAMGRRLWQLHLREVEQRADKAERTRDEAARRRAVEERLRIARELHDSLTPQHLGDPGTGRGGGPPGPQARRGGAAGPGSHPGGQCRRGPRAAGHAQRAAP